MSYCENKKKNENQIEVKYQHFMGPNFCLDPSFLGFQKVLKGKEGTFNDFVVHSQFWHIIRAFKLGRYTLWLFSGK